MKIIKILLITVAILGALALLGVYIGSHSIPVLEPKGLIGHKERDLIITCALLMLIVVIPVYILAIVFARKYRKSNTKSLIFIFIEKSTSL